MACRDTETTDELSFVQALHTRNREVGECRGPLLRLGLWSWRVFSLEQIFDSQAANDVLWAGMHEDGQLGIHFSLCAAHWMDLAALCWMRAQQHRRSDWHEEANQLLSEICVTAGWDVKEIVNMFAWQQARLT